MMRTLNSLKSRIGLFLSFAFLFTVVQCAGGDPHDCSLATDSNRPYPCVKYMNRKRIADSWVAIYHYARRWEGIEVEKDALEKIKEVAHEVLPQWKSYSKGMNIMLLLVPGLKEKFGGVTFARDGGRDCYIRIPAHYPKGQEESGNGLRQNIAHELYHCVQEKNKFWNSYEKPSRWHVEGLAEFYADQVYHRRGNDKGTDWIRQYNPSKSMLTQIEEASLFWQWAHQEGWSNNEINDFGTRQELSHTDAIERKRVSAMPIITNKFPGFAAAFKDAGIKFEDRSPIDTKKPIRNVPIVLQLSTDAPKRSVAVSTEAWTMKTYTAHIWPGQKVTMTFKPKEDGTVLQYRKTGEREWNRLDESSVTVTQECTNGDAEYIFLLTATADKNTGHGKLDFERESMEDCPCDGSTSLKVDPCLVGDWELDISSFRALFLKAWKKVSATLDPKVTINSFGASGKHTFHAEKDHKCSMDWKRFNFNAVASSGEVTTTMNTDINGHLDATLVMLKKKGAFCMKNPTATGMSRFSVAGFDIETPIQDGYGGNVYIKYKCSKKVLTIEGWSDGLQSWYYNYKRVPAQGTP